MNSRSVHTPTQENATVASGKTQKKTPENGKAEIFDNSSLQLAAIFSSASGTPSPNPSNIRFLQRCLGNHAVGKIIQAKLTIGQPNDKYEQEADRVADQVMRMPDPVLQPKPT